MKKILALLAVVLGVVSCQTEPEGLDVNVGGEQEVAVCVSLPEATRSNSAEGAFANVDFSGDKTIRYILKIYQKVGNEYKASTDRQVEYSDGTNVVFPVRLVPNRDYRFVVWADYVVSKDDRDLHYNTADLANITLNDTWVAMDETRDAFTGYFDTVDAGKQYTSTSSINITLKRPFAKLRVITTDMKELGFLGIEPHNAVVTYTTQFHESFNAFNGQYGAETVSKTHTGFEIKAYDDNVAKKSKVLFTDYFFADDSDVVKFVMNVNEANGTLIKSNTFNTDIAVQRNYLTTIQGNILTDGNNVKVTVDPAFENGSTWNPNEDEYDYATISSEAELLAAINGQGGQGGEYVVTSDIDVTGLVASTQAATRTTGTTTTTPTTTTINLNGKTITVTNKTGEPFATVAAGNTLFLEGGNIVLTEDSTASFIKNEGNVVLTSGTFENESDHTEAAVVEGKVIVEENATFNDDNTSKVNKVEGATAWLADVLTNGGTYVFTDNMTASEIIVVPATKAPVVLDGNGFTLTSTIGGTAGRAINVSGDKNVTIKNLNIVASGERAINIIQNAKNVTIENVTATAANYTVNVAGSAPGAIVAIKNSTLNGLCTVNVGAAGATVTVDDSTVNCNDYNTTEGEAYAALCLNKDAVGSKIIATNSTINVVEGSDSKAGRNGAEDGVVTINGGVEGVVVMNAVINPNNDYYYSFETIAAAIEFAKSGDAISLIRNVELTEPLEIAEDKNVVLDLNGKTLTGTMAKSVGHVVMNEGTLTVKNGTISSTGANGGSALYNAGTLTVEDAIINGSSIFDNGGWPSYPINNYGPVMTVKNSTINGYQGAVACNVPGTTTMENCTINKHYSNTSSHVFYISNTDAKVVVNGGTYTHDGMDGSLAYTMGEIIVNDGTFNTSGGGYGIAALSGGRVVVTGGTFNAGFLGWGGTITITGGTFKADPKNYLAEGYKAVQSGGKYVVVADEVDTVVSKASDLDIAVAAGENVVMSGDITASAKDTTASSGYGATGIKVANGATLDGNGNTLTINNAWGTWDCTIAATNGTIKNLTVNGAMRGIFMPGADGDVFIDNVIFKNVIYTFNSDAGNKNYGVYISNSTLNGWTSHSDVHKEVVYTNCSFGKGNGYAFCRPYGPTSFVGCNFCEGFEVEAIGKITFENCTIGGVALTAENLSTLVVGGIANASVK